MDKEAHLVKYRRYEAQNHFMVFTLNSKKQDKQNKLTQHRKVLRGRPMLASRICRTKTAVLTILWAVRVVWGSGCCHVQYLWGERGRGQSTMFRNHTRTLTWFMGSNASFFAWKRLKCYTCYIFSQYIFIYISLYFIWIFLQKLQKKPVKDEYQYSP